MALLSEVLIWIKGWIGPVAAILVILWCLMTGFILLNFNPPE